MERWQPRTELERRLRAGERTHAEVCKDFNDCAVRIGEKATLSPRQLARWLAGDVSKAHPAARRVTHTMFGASFNELVARPREASQPPAAVASPDSSTRDRNAGAVQLSPPLRSAVDEAALNEELMLAARESASFARRAQPDLSQARLEQLDADVGALARDYLSHQPFAMVKPLIALRAELSESLERHPRVTFLPPLYDAYSKVSALLALACSDLGRASESETNARAALLGSELSESEAIRPFVRWVQSQVAYWNGDFANAIAYADAGLKFAKDRPQAQLRLLSQKARAMAAVSDQTSVEETLGFASDLDTTVSSKDPVLSEGVFSFSPGKAAYYASEAWCALGGTANFHRAAKEAEKSIQLFAASAQGRSQEQVAAAQIDLAIAHVGLGDLDACSESIRPVVSLSSDRRTVPIVQRMESVRAVILKDSRISESRVARDLTDEIEVFNAYPATALSHSAIGG